MQHQEIYIPVSIEEICVLSLKIKPHNKTYLTHFFPRILSSVSIIFLGYLEVSTGGSLTFRVSTVDNFMRLYIGGSLEMEANFESVLKILLIYFMSL